MASKDILFLNEKVHQCSHPWPLEAWSWHFSGQNTWQAHKNIVTKSNLASNGSKDNLFFNEKVHRHSHPWPLEAWPGHFSCQDTLLVHKNIVAKSDLASDGPQGYFESANGLFCWETKDWWRPLEAKSDFGPMFFGTSQVFWPDICPGQASRGQGCAQWRIMDRRLNMRFAVPGASNKKSIFCQSYSFTQQFEFQNDILELHVVLAKKKLQLFEKYMKKPKILGFP